MKSYFLEKSALKQFTGIINNESQGHDFAVMYYSRKLHLRKFVVKGQKVKTKLGKQIFNPCCDIVKNITFDTREIL